MTVISFMLPKIWSATNKIFCHFGLLFALLPSSNPKNYYFEKNKKTPGDIIILHRCTINDNHMMYGSWDMKRDGQNFLSFWTVFCTFTHPNNPQNQNKKKWKRKAWRYHNFTQVYQKSWSYYAILFLRYGVWQM